MPSKTAMKELPDGQTMDELLALVKDAYEKAKLMYDTATEIAEKWEVRPLRQFLKKKIESQRKYFSGIPVVIDRFSQ